MWSEAMLYEKCYSLGFAIKATRRAKGLTQSQFANRLSISTRYLKSIENNGQKPSYKLLVQIVGELNLPIDSLLHSEYRTIILPSHKQTGIWRRKK